MDEVKIYCKSGDGGDGIVHFHREKYKPKGPPDGGDGGDGGHIIIKCNASLNTLHHLAYQKHFIAGNGQKGGKNNMKGKNGENLVIEVPPGTIIKKADSLELIGEVTRDGEEFILFRGGKGGRGNARFKSPVNRSPSYAEKGEKGQGGWIILELELLADIGIVGKPNAGKSTLLSVISNAKPVIADYPFTTITPQLGTVFLDKYRTFVVVEIPGLIENASQGKGLGISFLKHIKRVKGILYLISVESENIEKDIGMLKREIAEYDAKLLEKPSLVAISKLDLVTPEKRPLIEDNLLKHNFIPISSVTGYNIRTLKEEMWKIIHKIT